MSSSFSPSSSSPGSSRLQQQQQFGGVSQRLRSSSLRKPPEPLRRAVADCLASSSSSSLHGNPSTVASEAAKTLRDYLAASSTTDLAYSVIVEHALAERERSPAVVAKCVILLKRHLMR
ncbi:Integrin alpha-3 [Thalictrum thalictroides]|uniref:Integrin alpha-3 n=1 Tax=Thalictrum thalictroides TaxID=46969 RepID=A0A7J6WG09_THATH|nr:Integrin alpha-3 [Thalictrum thalictroides]